LSSFILLNLVQKKAPGRRSSGGFLCVHAPLEDPNVFQHTSPERLVRMMVMMVVFKLNAVHKILCE
jgi:hypothetical protein